jgi:hypothetical protein
VRPGHCDVIGIQKDDEDPGPRVLGHLIPLPLRVGLSACLLRTGRSDDDMLEGFDRLRGTVLEQLEVSRCEIGDGQAALRRVHVDADEVCFDVERGTRLRLLLTSLEGQDEERNDEERAPD